MNNLILLISEDTDYPIVFQNRLKEYDCRLINVKNCSEIDLRAMEAIPKIIIYDLLFEQEMECFSAIENIRDYLKIDSPIIIFSEVEDSAIIAHCLELGANEYLCRPFLKDSFIKIIEKYLKNKDELKSDFSFSKIQESAQKIKIFTKTNIHEINYSGFVFFTENLIAKGVNFNLIHPLIEEIFQKNSILLTVTKNDAYIKNGISGFLITTEVDGYDQEKTEKLRFWLNQNRTRS